MPPEPSFEWDDAKDRLNQAKHGVSFASAQEAFFDEHRVIAEDLEHSGAEPRFFCFGKVGDGHDCAVHVARRSRAHHRRRLLAKRQGHL
jgi:uncharacterized DUF497 family protein